MKHLSSTKAVGIGVAVLVPIAIILSWWFGSQESSNPFFPSLASILERFRELWLFDHFASDVLPSLASLAAGFLIAAFLGVGLGLLFALIPDAGRFLMPLVHFYRAVPAVAVIPVFIALLGFGPEVKLLVVVLAAFPPTLIATLDGIRAVEPLLKDVGRVYRLTSAERVLGVLLPSASPQIFSGLQVSLQFSFVVVIATEMLGSSEGIGAMTILAQQSFMSADMWAGILLLGAIGFFSNALLTFIRDRVLRWYDGLKALQLAA